jgi:hypothetical protein
MTNRLSEDQQGSYEPGPSFTDGAIPTPDADMLPGWLQRFGETTAADAPQVQAEPRADAQPEPAHAPDTTSRGATDDMQITAWLEEAAPDNADAPVDAAPSETELFSSADFLTDADLPDWLRSISTPPDVALPSSDEPEPAHMTAQAATATLPVPQVRRIWVTDQDAQDVSAGASMFAAVAEGSGTRPDILVSEAPVTPQPVATAPTTLAQPVAANATAEASTATSSDSAKSARMRLYLIAAIAVVLILALVMLLGR